MTEREKVIEALAMCEGFPHLCGLRKECPYSDNSEECEENMHKDALALLKEQEAVEPKTGHWIFEDAYYEAWSHTCSECGKRMSTAYNTYANYCWNCGAKMEGR